jgi:hypothetical protein
MRKVGLPERHQVGDEWLTAWEIAKRCGHKPQTVLWRIRHGWPMERVMGWPAWAGRNRTRWMLDGKPVTQRQLAEMAGVSDGMMSRRLNKRGMTPEQAVAAGNYRTGNY